MRDNFFLTIGVLLLICVFGCQPPPTQSVESDASEPEAANQDEADELAMLNILTTNVWSESTGGFHGHIETLTLKRTGEYDWTRTSDVTERDHHGRFSFELRTPTAGWLHLSESGDYPFHVVDGKLFIGQSNRAFPAGDKLAYTDVEKAITKLAPVPMCDTARKMVATAWVKTHPFDDYREPDRIEFHSDGTYSASYRDGDCKHGGTWGIDLVGIQLIGESEPNDCDLRGGSSGLTHARVSFQNDFLMMYETSYAPEDKRPEQTIFSFDRYGGSVRTIGRFDGPLTAGKETVLELEHVSASGAEFQLKSLEIGFQKTKIVRGGGETEGDPIWLIDRDLESATVRADEPFKQSVKFAPPFAGPVSFIIRLKYTSVTQDWDGYQTYFTDVK